MASSTSAETAPDRAPSAGDRPASFYFVTLGCPKNTVDSQAMTSLLAAAGYVETTELGQADVVIVNTCGFIDIAIDESTQALREVAKAKKRRQVLIAAGCLAQRYEAELRRAIPEIDDVVGTQRWNEIVAVVDKLVGPPQSRGPVPQPVTISRRCQGPSAYVKIADGCDASCAFCIIPQIKGPYRSKPLSEVVAEVRQLAAGTAEVVLIAQDTAAYGQDLGMVDGLAALLEEVVRAVPELPWLRLMYTYPERVSPRVIETMARHRQICHYLDLPLQHAHPATLERMRRPKNIDRTRDFVRRLRQAMPDIALRTTFIVGYPGETEAEFATLLAFLEEMRFEHVGVFTYSREEGTFAATLPHQVSAKVKRRRYEKAMELQQAISLSINAGLVGQTLDVLVEGEGELSDEGGGPSEPILVGRSRRDGPEVDGLVFLHGEAKVGQIVPVLIAEATEYDLWGQVVTPAGAPPARRVRSKGSGGKRGPEG
jgi:ribosomal protein S12 methylthiotransferase